MVFSILSLFPDMFSGFFGHSIIRRAKEAGIIILNVVNIRDFATDRYKTVDDRPYGGGIGMILRVDVIDRAIQEVKKVHKDLLTQTVLLDPKSALYTQEKAQDFTRFSHLILICGHYEGVDSRVEKLVDESLSIGDYIVTGGEIPAAVLVDSVTRLLPGTLKGEATRIESFIEPGVREFPQYTRPAVYKQMKVPQVLLSGNHARINQWRTTHRSRVSYLQSSDLPSVSRLKIK